MHDVTDASALRSWFNPPMAASLAAELYKATNIVRSFAAVGSRAPDAAVPAAILDGAAGFAILSVAKVRATLNPQSPLHPLKRLFTAARVLITSGQDKTCACTSEHHLCPLRHPFITRYSIMSRQAQDVYL